MKRFILGTFCLLGALLAAPLSFANQMPEALASDARIKEVAYNSNDVVTVRGSHFISTAIYFEPNEHILHVDAGNALAWDITPPTKETPNVLFIKPRLPQSDTNMTVITDTRIYQFRLVTRASDMPGSKRVTYALHFRYPGEEKQLFQQQLVNLQTTFLGKQPLNPLTWNYHYSFYGSKALAPLQTVDNGRFTIFKFSHQTAIPAIFRVDRFRHESLVNSHMEGNYMFVQGVNRQWTLRNGAEVTTVYNDAYRI